jgi:hypothetical protein
MSAADAWINSYETHSTGDSMDDLADEFWDHYEALKNIKVEPDKRESFFTCSC